MSDSKADIVCMSANELIGYPYVYGAWGDKCTPAVRKKYIGYNPDHEAAIKKKCQVLNGSKSSCIGCQWEGKICFDCRGFTHYLLSLVGINLSGGGCTTQWNTASNWAAKGEIKGGMPDVVCCVFKANGKTMEHTGMHVGGGKIIHCSAGVQTGKTTDKGWTHWAIPQGLYSDGDVCAAVDDAPKIRQTLKNGSKGDDVRDLQTLLVALGYPAGEIDGIFGKKTLAAVKAFQQDRGLEVDGIVGKNTWAALDKYDMPEEEPRQEVKYTLTVHGMTFEDATAMASELERYTVYIEKE